MNEVRLINDETELNACIFAKVLAMLHPFQKGILDEWVNLVKRHIEGANAVVFLTNT